MQGTGHQLQATEAIYVGAQARHSAGGKMGLHNGTQGHCERLRAVLSRTCPFAQISPASS